MSDSWFDSDDYQSLEITKHQSISRHAGIASTILTDLDTIQGIVERIKRIPTDGGMMVSFGPDAEHTTLVFSGACGEQILDIFGDRFKTPSTGFNYGDEGDETLLVGAIESLVTPEVGNVFLKIPGREYAFQGFKLAFKETKRLDDAPITVSGATDYYVLTPDGQTEQTLRVVAGQLPPPPLSFTVGSEEYMLLTFETRAKRDSQRLYPDYFQVVRAKEDPVTDDGRLYPRPPRRASWP